MIEVQPLNESSLARECLRRISDEKSALHSVEHVLELITRSSVGLGEVLQDYARQACCQLRDVIRVARNVIHGDAGQSEDAQVLGNIHFTLKAVKSVLDMTPTAMLRNKAEAIGEKEKLSRADISQASDIFMRSPDVVRLLAAEDSGHMLATLVTGGDAGEAVMVPEQEQLLASARP